VLFTLGTEDRIENFSLHVSNLVSVVKARLQVMQRIGWEAELGFGAGA